MRFMYEYENVVICKISAKTFPHSVSGPNKKHIVPHFHMMGETKLAICRCAAAQLGPGIFLDVRELPHLNMTAAESGGPSWPVPPNIVSPSCSAANILRLRGDGEMTRVQSRCI